MKIKRKYLKPSGKFLLIITEECLCNASGGSGSTNEDDVLVEDWENGGDGYGYGDL